MISFCDIKCIVTKDQRKIKSVGGFMRNHGLFLLHKSGGGASISEASALPM